MERITAMSGTPPQADIKVADFWETTSCRIFQWTVKPSTLNRTTRRVPE